MPENKCLIAGFILMVFSAGTFAQPEPSAAVLPSADSVPAPVPSGISPEPPVPIEPGHGVVSGELEALQGQNMLLEAQVQVARLQKQLAEEGQPSLAGSRSAVSVPAPGVTGRAPEVTAARQSGRITVQEISGRGKNLEAMLSFPDGRHIVVQTGSMLPGTSLKVKAITLSSVTLSDGQQLTF